MLIYELQYIIIVCYHIELLQYRSMAAELVDSIDIVVGM